MKIGLIAVGLNTYWNQFGGLRERLDGYRNAIKEKMEAYGGQIVADAGMVDDVDKAHAAAALFRRDEAEVLFIFISTYALSSTLIPFLGEGIPVVLLNLQPAPAIDYARLNGMSDRGEMTGEWLANCQAWFAARILFGIQPRRHQIRRGDGLPRRRAGLDRDLRVD